MKRSLLVFCLLLLLTGCLPAGAEGGKCLEGNAKCLGSNLICNYKNICEFCGEKGTPCCNGDACLEGLACTEWGCYECGGLAQPCCEGSLCQSDCTCDVDNTCQSCGTEGFTCCEGGICKDNSICGSESICQPCGMKGQPCCEGGDYQCFEGACVPGYTCQTEICDTSGNCSECGMITLPCCEGGTCHKGYICGANGQCENCGSQGDPVCEDGICNGYWQNVNGICKNPFKIDPTADITLCEKVDPGHGNIYQRDWCYWYAAFNKQDVSICTMIVWGTMKDKCQELADPDFYTITDWQ